jgi:hypothetical protein
MSDWHNLINIGPYSFTCGYCGRLVSSREGYITSEGYNSVRGYPVLFICPGCNKPTYFEGPRFARQTPASLLGNPVDHLPENIALAYREARECTKANAYTACVLVCRKLLMHIGVDQGAEEGIPFIAYVEYLADNGYVPPHGKPWVDHIRQKGNEANHEIVIMTKEDANDLLAFSEMLLKFIYEFPAKIPTEEQDSNQIEGTG